MVTLTTAEVGQFYGSDAVAGYGTGARLEYLLIPLMFGLGAPLVTLVSSNLGARQPERARRFAFTGAALGFALCEIVGLMGAAFPDHWLLLFGAAPAMLESGRTYLQEVAPFYGFYGLGLTLYFAAQGAGRMRFPLVAGSLRLVVAIVGGWLSLHLGMGLHGLFLALGAALLCYGLVLSCSFLTVFRRA